MGARDSGSACAHMQLHSLACHRSKRAGCRVAAMHGNGTRQQAARKWSQADLPAGGTASYGTWIKNQWGQADGPSAAVGAAQAWQAASRGACMGPVLPCHARIALATDHRSGSATRSSHKGPPARARCRSSATGWYGGPRHLSAVPRCGSRTVVSAPDARVSQQAAAASATERRCVVALRAMPRNTGHQTLPLACSINDLPDQLLGHIFAMAGLKALL